MFQCYSVLSVIAGCPSVSPGSFMSGRAKAGEILPELNWSNLSRSQLRPGLPWQCFLVMGWIQLRLWSVMTPSPGNSTTISHTTHPSHYHYIYTRIVLAGWETRQDTWNQDNCCLKWEPSINFQLLFVVRSIYIFWKRLSKISGI